MKPTDPNEHDYERAQREAFALLDTGFHLGGTVAATRDELHRRQSPAKYEYQSEFAKRYVAQGRAEGQAEGQAVGQAEGRAALLTRQLTLRFGALPPDAVARLSTASIDELDAIGERLLTSRTLQEALGPH
jgi:hypothetical protein